MRGLIGKTIENGFDFSAVPSGKGKLEKISVRIFSICDRKGAREDIRQDIFDLHCPRHCGTAKILSVSSRVRHLSRMAKIPLCDISRKPVHHGSLVLM
jgi:hypothetical protein